VMGNISRPLLKSLGGVISFLRYQMRLLTEFAMLDLKSCER